MTHHTKDKGDIAAAITIADLTIRGYCCFVPVVSEHLPFDLIAYKDNASVRIQVKYSQKGVISNKHGVHRKIYGAYDFDYYAVYLPDIKKVVYPSIKYGGKTITTILPNSATPFYWWEDFIDFTDDATHRIYKDFDYQLSATITDAVIAGRLRRRRAPRPTKEELEKMLWEQPTTQIAKAFTVSDKAVEKWAKSYGLMKPPRGYWAKQLVALK